MTNLFRFFNTIFQGKKVVRFNEFQIAEQAADYLKSLGVIPKDSRALLMAECNMCLIPDENGILRTVSYTVSEEGLVFDLVS